MVVSPRDVRAAAKNIEAVLHRYRSALGASDSTPEVKKTLKAELEEVLADVKALIRLSKGSGVDVAKLNEKVLAVRSCLSEAGRVGKSVEGSVCASPIGQTKSDPKISESLPIINNSLVTVSSLSLSRSETFPKGKESKDTQNSQNSQGSEDNADSLSGKSRASTVRSVIAKRNSLKRRQLEEEQEIRREVSESERVMHAEMQRKRDEAERRIMEARHRCEEAEAEIE